MTKHDLTPHIILIDGVYSAEECRALIAWSETHVYHPAPVAQVLIMPDVRNNTRVMFDDPECAAPIFARVAPHLPPSLEPGWHLHSVNERIRFYRYDVRERFAWHNDGVFFRSHYEWSFFTLMVYLNDDFAGGGTAFADGTQPSGVLRVQPTTGSVLLFRHDEPLRHMGERVTAGRKYVLRTDVMYTQSDVDAAGAR